MRQKLCALCNKDWKTMYRVKFKEGSAWERTFRGLSLYFSIRLMAQMEQHTLSSFVFKMKQDLNNL